MNEKQINIIIQRFNLIGGCIGCMSRDRKMVYNERLYECFRALADIHIPKDVIIQVCWECSEYINNIFKFKSIVERSYGILLDYSRNLDASGGLLDNFPCAEHRLETLSQQLIDLNELSIEPKEEDLEIIKHEINTDLDSQLGSPEEDTYGKILESYSLIKPATNEIILKDCEVRLIRLEHLQSLKVKPISNQSQDPSLRSLVFNHMETRSSGVGFCSKLCSYKRNDEKCLNDHEKTNIDEKTCIEDKELSYRFSYKPKNNHHLMTHTGEKPFVCNICSYKYSSQDNLNAHIKIHTRDKPLKFVCDICSHKFSLKSNLKVHMRIHTGEKPFACHICSYKCSRKAYLKDHIKTHTREKPFACDFCLFKCSLKGNLMVHMKIHTGEKPFVCNICSYKCRRKDRLNAHIKTHTREKHFACDICSYKCIQKSNLIAHMSIHKREKPFVCDICSYKCSRKAYLNGHMKTHTGEKHFACYICSYKCIRKCNFKRHLKRHKRKERYN